MNITTNQENGKLVIKIEGDLLIAGVADAKPLITSALAAGQEILLDLSDVGECDTAGIQLLLMARASALAQGKRLVTSSQSASFRAAVERIGVPVGCFECMEGTH
jgi:anti-sigma B factor antagonist/stage II sporulation protein AA (anti-sigma F factor antagonist)